MMGRATWDAFSFNARTISSRFRPKGAFRTLQGRSESVLRCGRSTCTARLVLARARTRIAAERGQKGVAGSPWCYGVLRFSAGGVILNGFPLN